MTVFYDDVDNNPIPNHKCPDCGGPVKIIWGWHPNYMVLCPNGHSSDFICVEVC